MRISYNGIITAFQAEDASSILAIRSIYYRGVEESGRPRLSHKQEIVGSNPTSATKYAQVSLSINSNLYK